MINLNEKAREREIRVFVSSTFSDLITERDHLVKKVFPRLRKLCQARGLEFTEVDLRWGVTEDQVQQGKVIEVCLREIDRCRPYFIGLLGERYGWVPGPDEYGKHKRIIEDFTWVKGDIQEGLSITEMEVQYGVLRNKEMTESAFFYLRDIEATPDHFKEEKGSEAEVKLKKIKHLITEVLGYPHHYFSTPEELGQALEGDFTRYLDARFPEKERPTPLEQERLDHAAFARSRLKVYIGGEKYHEILDRHVEGTGPPLVVTGEPGSGKSALLATWIAHYQQKNPDVYILYHFIGGAPDSADHYSLMRRIMFELKERFGIEDDIPTKQEQLAEFLPLFFARTTKEPWVLILDALNQLEEKDNARWLGWLPSFFPENIRVILSTLPGEALDALKKREYAQMVVTPLTLSERRDLIKEYLKFYARELNEDRTTQIAINQKAGNPLILRTIIDELRIVGFHEKLQEQIAYYLQSTAPIAFFTAVLERLERDYEEKHKGMTGKLMSLLWASRRGLSERELLDITGIPTLSWAPLYYALESHLVQREGLLDFFNDFLKQAVEERYLKTDEAKKKTHIILADYFHKDRLSERALDELPYHLTKAKEWENLKDYIGDLDVFIKLNKDKKKYELLGYWNAIGNRYDMAAVYREGLDLLEEKGGTESGLAYSYNSVASFLKDAARFEGAEPLLCRALGIYEKVLGPKHPDTAQSLNNLALLLKSKGDYEGAEPLYRRALWIDEKVLGPEHPYTATILNNLALLLDSKGDYEGAEPLYRRALGIREKVLGPEHPYTATSLNNLAALLDSKGDFAGAEPLYRRALGINEKVLGPEHPDIAGSLNNLAFLLYSKGDYAGAELLYRRALELYEKVLGPEHPYTAGSLNNLAGLLYSKGKYEAAEPLYRRALEINEKVLGPEHPDVATSHINLALLLRDKGAHSEAADNFRSFLRIYEKQKVSSPNILNQMATCHNELAYNSEVPAKDWEKAELHYRKAIELLKMVPNPVETANAELNLQTMFRLSGQKVDKSRVKELTRILKQAGDKRAEKGYKILKEGEDG